MAVAAVWVSDCQSDQRPVPFANVVVAGSTAYSTNVIGAGNQYFRLAR